MGKKSSTVAVSKTSSASAPTNSSSTGATSRSSVLKSSFTPSYLQLHLFASVIQSFDVQQLRIHDTSTGRLRQQHNAHPGATITSLDWGHYRLGFREESQNTNKKKRKRALNAKEDVVIAYGTTESEICMYSPAEGRIVGTLSGAHERGIHDFKFSEQGKAEGWSIGGDGKLVQWDLTSNRAISSVPLPDSSISILAQPSVREPRILCASTTPFSIYPSEEFRVDSFDSFKGQVHSLQRAVGGSVQSSELFIAADNDRYINIFSIAQRKLVRTLVTGSEAEQIDISQPIDATDAEDGNQLLSVVTRDGAVELFSHPFKLPPLVNGDLKSRRKNMTRKSTAQVRLLSTNHKHASIFGASIQGPELVIVSVESGVDPVFQRVRWQDEGTGDLLFEGTREIVKAKSASTLSAAQMNGVKDMGKTHIDESRIVVVNGANESGLQDAAIEISSEEDNDEDDIESDGESEAEVPAINGDEEVSESEHEAEQADSLAVAKMPMAEEDAEMEDVADQEPSFGDLLAAKHPKTIAIADSFQPEKSTFDADKQLALPSGMSLGTVLTQALRTNDTNLLESCLHANDAGIIQNTIQRLDSMLAAGLLSKLAERLASRPGRYGHLLSWVQWTCIAHGGAIAGQPDVVAKIRTLYRVLNQRSRSLDKLLLLKGKLDMLDAQLTFRKQIQAQRSGHIQAQGEPGMIYIEGQEDNWSSDEDLDEAVGDSRRIKHTKRKQRALEDISGDIGTSEDDDTDEMPTMNGIASDGSEEEDSDEEAEVTGRTKGMYDIEAEVSGEEEASDDEEDSEGVEDSDDEGIDDDDEEDSEMDGFINDGEISYVSDEGEIDLDDEPEIRKLEKKKSKHR